MDFQSWLLFASIAFVATVTPGPAILLATSHSAVYGWRHAVFTILGNITGLLIMSTFSILGLSAIILSSVILFELIKLLGAMYLIYLGIKLWRNGFVPVGGSSSTGEGALANRKGAYFQGVAVALSNPKAIAFTTALFPQFIVHNGNLPLQFSLLTGTLMMLSFSCLLAYSLLVHRARTQRLLADGGVLSKLFGSAFVASGVLLLTASRGDT